MKAQRAKESPAKVLNQGVPVVIFAFTIITVATGVEKGLEQLEGKTGDRETMGGCCREVVAVTGFESMLA